LGRLKSTIYARMEEMSFRSGAVVVAGVLVAAGVAITLAAALGGHGAAATSAPSPAAVARSTPPPSPVLSAALPSATAQATPVASLMPAGGYQPPAPVTAAATPRASAASSSAAGLPTPWHPRPTPTPHMTGQPVPVVHNPGGLSALAPGSPRGGRPDRDGGGPPGRPQRGHCLDPLRVLGEQGRIG
jgi:hypothetical protein